MRASKLAIVAVVTLVLVAPPATAAEVEPDDPGFDLRGEAMPPPTSIHGSPGPDRWAQGGMQCGAPRPPGRDRGTKIGVTITSDSSAERATARFTVGGGTVLDRETGAFTTGPLFELGTGEVTVVRVHRMSGEPIERPGPGAEYRVDPIYPGDPNTFTHLPGYGSTIEHDGHPDARYSCSFGQAGDAALIVYRTPVPYPTESELQAWCDANLEDWRDLDDASERNWPVPSCPVSASRPDPVEPEPEPEPATCIRSSNSSHIRNGRAVRHRWRAYASGRHDALGWASRHTTTSLRRRADGSWERVPSCP